ncbi:unnamed protein product, partial [Owenia fusiformis]
KKMSADISNSFHNLRQNARSSHYSAANFQPLITTVISIHRYIPDPTVFKDLYKDSSDVYDIVISEDGYKMKCVLGAGLHELVQKNKLRCGVMVELTDCVLHFDEADLAGGGYVIINQLTIKPTSSTIDLDYSAIQWLDVCSDREKEDLPLTGRRGYYLPLWNSEDCQGEIWQQTVEPKYHQNGINTKDVISLRDLSDTWKKRKRPYPPLLVRVMHKSRPLHYGKKDRGDKWPYQVYIEVGDRSGTCTAVLWNSLCPELYYSLEDGSVLRLHNYTVREQFQVRSKPTLRNTTMERFNIEIGLNKHHPQADVTFVHHRNLKTKWNLPPLKYNFISRKNISGLPQDFNCDVIGLVTHVGQFERERKKAKDGTSCGHQFWLKRWIQIKDGSSDKPLFIELYSTSQCEVHNELWRGNIVVLTQMRVMHSTESMKNSRTHRNIYLTTTNESKVYSATADNEYKPYDSYEKTPEYKNLLSWISSNRDFLKNSITLGGTSVYPTLPTTLGDYKALYTDEDTIKVTPLNELEAVIKDLKYLEHKRVHIQGHIVHIEFLPASASQPDQLPDLVSPIAGRVRSKRKGQPITAKETQSSAKKSTPEGSEQCNKENIVMVDPIWKNLESSSIGTLGSKPGPYVYTYQYTQAHRLLLNEHFQLQLSSGVPNNVEGSLHDLQPYDTIGCLCFTILGLNGEAVVKASLPLSSKVPSTTTLKDVLTGNTLTDASHTSTLSVKDVQHLLKCTEDVFLHFCSSLSFNVRVACGNEDGTTGNFGPIEINIYPEQGWQPKNYTVYTFNDGDCLFEALYGFTYPVFNNDAGASRYSKVIPAQAYVNVDDASEQCGAIRKTMADIEVAVVVMEGTILKASDKVFNVRCSYGGEDSATGSVAASGK